MKPIYPAEVGVVLSRLTGAGYAAYIVGGALRDALMGREAHDWDVATSALPEETEAVFGDFHVIKTGMKHGTVTVVVSGMPVEITTFRIDGAYHDARHPDRVVFTDRIEEDLARRDFTINAMAYSEEMGLVDVFGGREDLGRGVIRAVGDAATRFSEDALRILRAFRFQSKLDFDIDEATLAAARDERGGLARVSAERITAELCGLFEGAAPCRALAAMLGCGIFDAIAPDWIPPREAGMTEKLPPVFEVRFAAFLRGCEDGGEGLIKRLRLSGRSAARVRALLALGDFDLCPDETCVRRLLARAGVHSDDIAPLVRAGFFGLSEGERDRVVDAIEQIGARGDCLTCGELAVDGRDLAALGLSGKDIGRTLEVLLDAVLRDPALNRKETLLTLARGAEL